MRSSRTARIHSPVNSDLENETGQRRAHFGCRGSLSTNRVDSSDNARVYKYMVDRFTQEQSILIEIYFFTSHATPHTTPRFVRTAGILDQCSNILLRLRLI